MNMLVYIEQIFTIFEYRKLLVFVKNSFPTLAIQNIPMYEHIISENRSDKIVTSLNLIFTFCFFFCNVYNV